MAQLSVLDYYLEFKASRSLWSHSATERLMAGTFLTLGRQLQAQWENNALQRRLCLHAVETNSRLADIQRSLEELRAGQEQTNNLLGQSLAIQTDHYMLDKRERVLKDALFRWDEIFSDKGDLSDSHWVVVATRMFLRFLDGWKFVTEDVSQTEDKKQLLRLKRFAEDTLRKMDEAVLCEVNLFECGYDEYMALPSVDEVARASESDFACEHQGSTLNAPTVSDITRLFEKKTGLKYPGHVLIYATTSGNPPSTNEQLGFVNRVADQVTKTGETALLGIYCHSASAERQRDVLDRFVEMFAPRRVVEAICILFTDRAWHAYVNPASIGKKKQNRQNPEAHPEITTASYRSKDRCTIWRSVSLSPEVEPLLKKALAFVDSIHSLWTNHATNDRAEYERKKDEAKRKHVSQRIQEHTEKRATARARINEFLDLHPGIKEWYRPVEAPAEQERHEQEVAQGRGVGPKATTDEGVPEPRLAKTTHASQRGKASKRRPPQKKKPKHK